MDSNEPATNSSPRENKFMVIVIIVAIISLGGFGYGYLWYEKQNAFPADYKESFPTAIQEADVSVIETIPPASSMSDNSTEDAEKLFYASRTATVFDYNDRTTEYLAKILDSNSPDFEPYKSISAYFLVHSFYDTFGDITFMANAVRSVRFMDTVTKDAATAFPKLFQIPLENMTYSQKSLYFSSYLIALSKREDSAAIPANSALELSRAYIQMKKYPDSALYKVTSLTEIEEELHAQLNIAIERIEKRRRLNFSTESGLNHDTIVGLNLTSLTIDSLRANGFIEKFPEGKDVNIVSNFENSRRLSTDKEGSLYMFTTYIYLRHMATMESQTAANDEKIESLVRNLIGEDPYPNIKQYSWITKTLSKVQNTDNIYSYYTLKDIMAIASRSSNFDNYLTVKGYIKNSQSI